MKNIENWKPSVYKKDKNGTLVAHECADCSRFVVNVNALQMQDVIEKYAKGDVVDLGCGKVPLYVLYKDISRINSVFCVDWSNTFHGGEHVDLVADLSQKLSVDDCKFDTVVSTSVLEHLPDVKIAFEEFNRILKNDGHVILQVPFLYWIHEAPFDYCRYTHFYLEKISKENNLKIVERRIIGGASFVIFDILGKRFAMSRFKFMVPVVQKVAYFLYKIRPHFTADIFPIMYIYVLQKGEQ